MDVSDIPARAARRTGQAVAIAEAVSGRRITFAELERRVDGLARALAAQPGIRPGDRISILALNGIEYFEVYFAAARAGLVAQGLNWRLATDELERIVRDAEPSVLVAGADFADTVAELARRTDPGLVLTFGDDSDGSYEDFVAAGTALDVRPVPGGAGDPVLIIYTGGSSGDPKGAVHTNRSCIAAMVNNTVAERVVATDRYLVLGQMFHSAAVLALNYLMHGATVVVLPRFEARQALEVIEAERVTTSLAFPAMINYMLAEADDRRFDLASLRNMQYGGGPVARRVIEEMMDVLPCTLIQCYGSSEHVGVTFLSQEDHLERTRLASCGREAYLTRVRLLDEHGAEVPWDGRSTGEIHVSSPANMMGYWRRPELTEAITRGGWQGTGDLAYADADGYFTVVDRIKDVIVSGGENIYAAQVEKAIAAHPAVLEVAVVGIADPLWGEAVKAVVVLKAGRSATAEEIQDTVRSSLASYQKPRVVEFAAQLPKTPAGKVAKQALRGSVAAIGCG